MNDMTAKNYFLSSERLVFSHWTTEDIEFAQLLWGNPRVSRLISKEGFSQSEIANKLSTEIKYQATFGYQYFPIANIESKELIGCCGFHPLEKNTSQAELGCHILPDFWGQGIAYEANLKILEFAKQNFDLETVIAGHNPDNHASAKLLKKLGFERIEDQFYEPTGLMHPTYQLNLKPKKPKTI